MPSNTTVSYNTWSPWYPFGQLFEYRGLVDETDMTQRRKKEVTWKGSTGFMHRDNGFRLRSFDYTSGSFRNMPLWVPLEDLPCPLNNGDLGVYWLRINTDQGQYNYIGLCGSDQNSIFKRLVDHFTKIAGTFEHSSGFKDTGNFKDFRVKLKELDLDTDSSDFFEKRVEIAFVKVESRELTPQKVAKIEGMAIQAFKNKFGHFPELNSRNETIGLEGMPLEG